MGVPEDRLVPQRAERVAEAEGREGLFAPLFCFLPCVTLRVWSIPVPHGHYRWRGTGIPFNTGCIPLDYSGNPGVNGVSYMGVVALPARSPSTPSWSCRRRSV